MHQYLPKLHDPGIHWFECVIAHSSEPEMKEKQK